MRFKFSPAFLQELEERGIRPERLKRYLRGLVKGYKHRDLRVFLRSARLKHERWAWSGIYYPSERRLVVTVQKGILLPAVVHAKIGRGKSAYVGIKTFEELVGWGFLHEFRHYAEDKRGWRLKHWKNYLWCLRRLFTENGRYEFRPAKSVCRLCGFQVIHQNWRWDTFFSHLSTHFASDREKALKLLIEVGDYRTHGTFAEDQHLCSECLSEALPDFGFKCEKHAPKPKEEVMPALEEVKEVGICPDCKHFVTRGKAISEGLMPNYAMTDRHPGYCRQGRFPVFEDSINTPCRSFTRK